MIGFTILKHQTLGRLEVHTLLACICFKLLWVIRAYGDTGACHERPAMSMYSVGPVYEIAKLVNNSNNYMVYECL